LEWDTVIPLDAMWAEFKRVIKPRGAIVLTAAQPFTSQLVMSNLKWYRHEWIWEKSNATSGFLNAKKAPLKQHEQVLVFSKESPNYYPQMIEGGDKKRRFSLNYSGRSGKGQYPTLNIPPKELNDRRYPKSVIKFATAYHEGFGGAAGKNILIHPTQKPVELMAYLVRTYTREGDVVLDPTCGSGTTAVACIRSNRNFICGDYEQKYVELANKRIADVDPYCDTVIKDRVMQKSLFQLSND
jgi:site-specific DNA-methyltransferase (adenine-specific)